jgi:hypothetical protein
VIFVGRQMMFTDDIKKITTPQDVPKMMMLLLLFFILATHC